jgi:hypothetical protein
MIDDRLSGAASLETDRPTVRRGRARDPFQNLYQVEVWRADDRPRRTVPLFDDRLTARANRDVTHGPAL